MCRISANENYKHSGQLSPRLNVFFSKSVFFKLFIENSQNLQLTIFKTCNYTNKQQQQEQKTHKKSYKLVLKY